MYGVGIRGVEWGIWGGYGVYREDMGGRYGVYGGGYGGRWGRGHTEWNRGCMGRMGGSHLA